jgi:hypothetical protein
MNVVLQVNAFPITVMFGMCSIFLCMAAILQRRLMVVSDHHKSTSMFNLFYVSTIVFIFPPESDAGHFNFNCGIKFVAEAVEMTAEDEPLNP